jgi:hypothetical protein
MAPYFDIGALAPCVQLGARLFIPFFATSNQQKFYLELSLRFGATLTPEFNKQTTCGGNEMSFQAYCPECKKTVTASQVGLTDEELRLALNKNEDIEVMHPSHNGDHRWRPDNQARENMRNSITKGAFGG